MRALAVAAAVALAAGCAPPALRAEAPGAVEDPEAYAVYGAVIRGTWPVTYAKATRLVIRAETVRNDRCGLSGPPVEGEWKDVVDAFARANARPRPLVPDMPMQPPYVLATPDELRQVFQREPGDEGDWWKPFYTKYPDSGGYFEVSAVGFDERRTRAMVYVAYHCGSLCAGGQHYLLEKIGAWTEVRPEGLDVCEWMS